MEGAGVGCRHDGGACSRRWCRLSRPSRARFYAWDVVVCVWKARKLLRSFYAVRNACRKAGVLSLVCIIALLTLDANHISVYVATLLT